MDIATVKQWLKDNGRTQQWLADEARLDITTINKWLNNRTPLSPSSQKLVELILSPSNTNTPSVSPTSLSDEELTTAAQSLGKSPSELIRSVLYTVSDKIAADFEQR